MTVADGFLEATVRSATPLAFAALGELIAERSGVINIGLEGSIALGAFVALLATAAFGPATGLVAGGLAGAAIALVFATFVVTLRAQQVLAGTAVSLLGLGLAAALHRISMIGPDAVSQVVTIPVVTIPVFSQIPLVGPALFAQPLTTYALYLLFPTAWFFLYRTVGGVVVRATGENPEAAHASGHSPDAVRFGAVVVGGFFAGIGGATLVVAQVGTFSDGMSAGRGFIAIAIVALGRWHPGGVAVGALVFGAVSALQFLAQSLGWSVPYNLLLAFPYLLTLIAMAAFGGVQASPAALGRDGATRR
ncbi:MAG: ABC transporter permease [Gemmatimonadota bacterium]|nr:ABC transporter permease [Gemmatimonadota bacterium]